MWCLVHLQSVLAGKLQVQRGCVIYVIGLTTVHSAMRQARVRDLNTYSEDCAKLDTLLCPASLAGIATGPLDVLWCQCGVGTLLEVRKLRKHCQAVSFTCKAAACPSCRRLM